MRGQFLLWCCAWCQLLDAVVGVATLGFIRTSTHLWMAKKYSKYEWGKKNKCHVCGCTDNSHENYCSVGLGLGI